jgi:ferredoxin
VKTVIYYFSGTGNSLSAAKKIGGYLGETELVPIASLRGIPGDIVPVAEKVGIICPVYFAGLPAMVALFAGRLDLSAVRYVFSVITYGGGGAESTLAQLDTILRSRSGRGLSAGYFVKMPGNYILMYEPPGGEKLERILSEADNGIRKIAGEILQGKVQPLRRSFLWGLVHALMYSRFISRVHREDRKFTVNDECTACGTCVAVCPAKNIGIVDNKPVWQHRCELCCACIHNCPMQAIQAGTATEKRHRYRNPGVTVAELKG